MTYCAFAVRYCFGYGFVKVHHFYCPEVQYPGMNIRFGESHIELTQSVYLRSIEDRLKLGTLEVASTPYLISREWKANSGSLG